MSPPLSLSDPDAARVRRYADDIVTRLIDGYGCDNTSLSMWRSFLRPCDPDEQGRTTRPSCIEINTRTFAQFAPAYALAFENGCPYAALARTLLPVVGAAHDEESSGDGGSAEVEVVAPTHVGKFGANLYVYTAIEGPAEDSVLFDAVAQLQARGELSGLQLLVQEGQELAHTGWRWTLALLGFLDRAGSSPQEINKEFTRVLKVILTDAAYESNPTVADADALSTWFQERSGEGRRAAH